MQKHFMNFHTYNKQWHFSQKFHYYFFFSFEKAELHNKFSFENHIFPPQSTVSQRLRVHYMHYKTRFNSVLMISATIVPYHIHYKACNFVFY